MWKNTPQNSINVEKYATRICHKSSTFAAKNENMKQPYQTTLEALVCKRVKQLLNERNISVIQLATAIYKDHSQLFG